MLFHPATPSRPQREPGILKPEPAAPPVACAFGSPGAKDEEPELSSSSITPIIPAGKLLGTAGTPGWLSRQLKYLHGLFSLASRREWARTHTTARVDVWEKRGFFSREEAQKLRDYLASQPLPSYMQDFANHVAITVPFFVLSVMTNGPLTLAGKMSAKQWFLIHSLSGCALRTAYTLKRQYDLRHEPAHEFPWIAFLWPLPGSFLPFGLGNAGYLAQQLKCPPSEKAVARFILLDFVTTAFQRGPLGRTINRYIYQRAKHSLIPEYRDSASTQPPTM